MNRTKVFIAACAGMAFFGVAMLSLGPILTQLESVVAGATALPSTMSIGIIAGTLLFGPIVDRFGYKWLMVIAATMALAGVQGLALFDTLPLLHGSILLLGAGGGILNGATNALVSDIYQDPARGTRLGILGAFYCIGALLWTLLHYFMPDYHQPLNLVSAVMLLFIIYFVCTRFPKPDAKSKNEETAKSTLSLAWQPLLLAFAIVLFFQSGFEGSTGSFSVSYLCNMHMMPQGAATLSLTWFTIGMMGGRFALGAIMSRLKKMGTLYLYLSVALVGVAVFGLTASTTGAYVAMALIGFGVGATFPIVIDYIVGAFPQNAGTALSIAMFIGLLGQFAFNKCVGLAFNSQEYVVLPFVLAGAVIAMMVLLPIAVKIANKK